jgi:hypothetical protein
MDRKNCVKGFFIRHDVIIERSGSDLVGIERSEYDAYLIHTQQRY